MYIIPFYNNRVYSTGNCYIVATSLIGAAGETFDMGCTFVLDLPSEIVYLTQCQRFSVIALRLGYQFSLKIFMKNQEM